MKKLSVMAVLLVFITGNLWTSQGVDGRNNSFTHEAEILKELTLFRGSDLGFELNRVATRIEAAVILVRLLGVEQDVLDHSYDHPFVDVPDWADQYVGYLYSQNLTKGISDQEYGSQDQMTPNQFMTFCLRSIHYDDEAGDFIWSRAIEKAVALDIIDEAYKEFLETQTYIYRDDVVAILFNLLNTPMHNGEYALIDVLIEKGIFSLEKALDLRVYRQFHLYQETLLITDIHGDEKPVVVSTEQGVRHFVLMPFSELEEPYMTCLRGVTGLGVKYSVYISKEVSLSSQLEAIKVGDRLDIVGELAVNLLDEKTEYIECFYHLPK